MMEGDWGERQQLREIGGGRGDNWSEFGGRNDKTLL